MPPPRPYPGIELSRGVTLSSELRADALKNYLEVYTPTPSKTPTDTSTPTPRPTSTITPTPTVTSTSTRTPTPTRTRTPTVRPQHLKLPGMVKITIPFIQVSNSLLCQIGKTDYTPPPTDSRPDRRSRHDSRPRRLFGVVSGSVTPFDFRSAMISSTSSSERVL